MSCTHFGDYKVPIHKSLQGYHLDELQCTAVAFGTCVSDTQCAKEFQWIFIEICLPVTLKPYKGQVYLVFLIWLVEYIQNDTCKGITLSIIMLKSVGKCQPSSLRPFPTFCEWHLAKWYPFLMFIHDHRRSFVYLAAYCDYFLTKKSTVDKSKLVINVHDQP